jgi:hypothetical protein
MALNGWPGPMLRINMLQLQKNAAGAGAFVSALRKAVDDSRFTKGGMQ